MKRIGIAVLVATCGCMRFTAPGAPAPHSAMPVAASFGKTWDAVIDVFATKNIPVRTLERVSGLIAAEPSSVESFDPTKEHPWADCGAVGVGGRGGKSFSQPSSAFYNVRVRGDSLGSTVLVTVRWKYAVTKESLGTDCSTRGVWETDVEREIKRLAEGDKGIFRGASSQQRPTTPSETASRQSKASATVGAPASLAERDEGAVAFTRGKSYIGSHEWSKAEASFREALRLDGSVPEYHAALGSLLMTLKRWDEAEAEFAAAVLLDVDNTEYRRLLKTARSKR